MAKRPLNTRGTLKQDLTAARAELKQFRHDLSILRKKGLVDKSKYDARSAKPTKYLKAQIKKFETVVSGDATAAKVSKAKAKYYAEKGYTVKNGRVIVPRQANQKIISSHGNFIVKTFGRGGSITQIDLGFNQEDIAEWLEDLRNSRIKLGDDEELAFQFRGHNSHRSFGKGTQGGLTAQERMANYLEGYALVREAINGQQSDTESIESIVIFRVERGARPEPNAEVIRMDEEARRRYNDRQKVRREIRLGGMSEDRYNQAMKERAEAEKKRRSKMTPEQAAEYKRKAAERAKKSRDAKKGKK